jgi:quercetin dioxygenase-like cupin family protein
MVPEAPLERTEHGLVPAGDGWFVLNARDAVWRDGPGRGAICDFEGRPEFPQLGINVSVLHPGETMAMYHWEADQEDFLVLAGEALLIVEGKERPLRAWDFVHCPAETKHVVLGAGNGPCIVLAVGARDLRARPFAERRRVLADVFVQAPPGLQLTPATDDRAVAARWLDEPSAAGIDGVVAKHPELRYQPGVRAMVKVKRQHTAECVVAGFRWLADRPLPSSLLLGLYDDDGALVHVGVTSSFAAAERERLLAMLAPHAAELAGHPWEHGFLLTGNPIGRLKGSAGRWTPEMEQDWLPLAPDLVCEVSYDQLDDRRFRHPASFRRWRPDRDPGSCRLDQLDPVAE